MSNNASDSQFAVVTVLNLIMHSSTFSSLGISMCLLEGAVLSFCDASVFWEILLCLVFYLLPVMDLDPVCIDPQKANPR